MRLFGGLLLAMSVVAGTAAARDEITVRAAPGPYKPFDVFLRDEYDCGRLVHDRIPAPPANSAPNTGTGTSGGAPAAPASDDATSEHLNKIYGDCMTARGDQVEGYPPLTPLNPPPPPNAPPPKP
jgi:hypothetical protein